MSPFNPYLQWLGISDAVGTPNHYRLLGLRLFEDQPAAVSAAVTRVGGILTSQLSGPYLSEARRLLKEMETARHCLLNPTAKAAYDAALRRELSTAPPNPLASIPDAEAIDPRLPPTAMAWRSATPAVPLPPSAASPMPPTASPMPSPPSPMLPPASSPMPMAGGSSSYSSSPPLPPGALPLGPMAAGLDPTDADAILPPSVGSGPYTSMPLPPGSYAAGGYQAPLAAPPAPVSVPVYAAPVAMNYPPPASPAAFAQPAAIPIAAPVAPAAVAIPVAAPAQIATPVYAAPAYSAPSAVPIAQPVLAQAAVPQAAAVATASYAEEPAIVAPRTRLSWRRPKPPTAGLLLGSATIVLVVVAVLVVAANRPDADPAQQDDRSQVARAARTDDTPSINAQREEPSSRSERKPADRSANPKIDGDDIAMPPVAINPPPRPAPKPTPAPAPKPVPPAIPDAQKDETVTKALNLARVALSKSDPRTARTHVEAAQKAMAPNRADEIDRVEALAKYTEEFGNAVRQGIKGLEITGQLPIKGSFAGVVEAEGDSFMLRIEGKNTPRFQVASLPAVGSLPPEIAYALAENWLSKDAAPTKIILGTYQAMHPHGDRAFARTLWQAAADGGAKIVAEQLLPELNVPLPTAAGTAAMAEDDKPGADGRLPLPRATAQSQARTEVRQMFEADFAGAKDAVTKLPLVAKLLERAEQPSDTAAVRYILLLEAGKLAAEAGDFEHMGAALDKLGELYAADAIALKADALFEASKTAEGKPMNQALATAALSFCDEAVLSDKIDAAIKIAGTARAAALKSGDADLQKQCTFRQKEVRELKK